MLDAVLLTSRYNDGSLGPHWAQCGQWIVASANGSKGSIAPVHGFEKQDALP